MSAHQQLNRLAKMVTDETLAYIINQAHIAPCTPPTLPCWFPKAHNELRRQATDLGVECSSLSLMLQEIFITIMRYYGVPDVFPQLDEEGFMEETEENDSVEKLFSDIVDFIDCHFQRNLDVPDFPIAVLLVEKDYERQFALAQGFPAHADTYIGLAEQLQEYLENDEDFGEMIPEDYVPDE